MLTVHNETIAVRTTSIITRVKYNTDPMKSVLIEVTETIHV